MGCIWDVPYNNTCLTTEALRSRSRLDQYLDNEDFINAIKMLIKVWLSWFYFYTRPTIYIISNLVVPIQVLVSVDDTITTSNICAWLYTDKSTTCPERLILKSAHKPSNVGYYIKKKKQKKIKDRKGNDILDPDIITSIPLFRRPKSSKNHILRFHFHVVYVLVCSNRSPPATLPHPFSFPGVYRTTLHTPSREQVRSHAECRVQYVSGGLPKTVARRPRGRVCWACERSFVQPFSLWGSPPCRGKICACARRGSPRTLDKGLVRERPATPKYPSRTSLCRGGALLSLLCFATREGVLFECAGFLRMVTLR